MSTKIKMIAMALLAMLNVTVCAQNLRIDKVEIRGREIKEGVDDKGRKLYDLGVVMSGTRDKDVCKIIVTNLSNKALELEVRRVGTIFFVKEGNVVNDKLYNMTIMANGKMVISFVCKRDDEHPMKKFNTIIIKSRINELDEWTTSFNSQISYYGLSYERELAFLERDGKWGAMDINQKTVIPFAYEELSVSSYEFSENEIKAKKNNNWGLIDRQNRVLIPFEYEEVLSGFKNGYAKVKKNDKFYIITENNTVVYELAKNGLGTIMKGEEGILVFVKNGKLGYIDKDYNILIPAEYTSAFPYGFGRLWGVAKVEKYGKWGLVDKTNHVILPFEYDDIHGYELSVQAYEVTKNGKRGMVDKTNHVIIPFEYDMYINVISSGEIHVNKNGKWGIIDSSNRVVIPFDYEYISGHLFPSKILIVKKNGKWGKIDENNKVVTPFIYDKESDMK